MYTAARGHPKGSRGHGVKGQRQRSLSRVGETAAMDLAKEDGGGASLQVGAGAAMWSNSDGEGLEATGVQVARSSVATAQALACFSGARTMGIG